MRKAIMGCGLLGGLLLLGLGALLLTQELAWLQGGWTVDPLGAADTSRNLGGVAICLGALCTGGSIFLARRMLAVCLLLGLIDVAGLLIVYVSPDVGRATRWYAVPAVLLGVAAFLAAIQLGRETEALPLDAPD
jgi:hypothetical protein